MVERHDHFSPVSWHVLGNRIDVHKLYAIELEHFLTKDRAFNLCVSESICVDNLILGTIGKDLRNYTSSNFYLSVVGLGEDRSDRGELRSALYGLVDEGMESRLFSPLFRLGLDCNLHVFFLFDDKLCFSSFNSEPALRLDLLIFDALLGLFFFLNDAPSLYSLSSKLTLRFIFFCFDNSKIFFLFLFNALLFS